MAVDMSTPDSPGWWLARLGKKLTKRAKHFDQLARYQCGDHPLPEGDERAREMFRRFQAKARTNYCALITGAVNERLHVGGFRTGGSTDFDKQAWRIFQQNHMDADSGLVHGAALTFGEAYAAVGAEDGQPLITPEDPREVIVEVDPRNRRKYRAGLKLWCDDVDKTRHAVVMLPDGVHYFHSRVDQYSNKDDRFDPSVWDVEQDSAANPLGVVPLVRFVNRPTLCGDGMGEFEDVLDVQDRINDTTLNRMVVVKMQAYRQRWAKGIETEDEDGNPLDLPFVPGVDLLWAVADPDVEFGDFSEASLSPVLEAVREDVKALVMLTGLPPHYVAGDLVNASADALAAAEARLVAKVRERQRHFGESWEQVMRLAFRVAGLPQPEDAEVIWLDPERKSDAQLADAAVKKQQAGVPWRQRMSDMQYSPQQIERMESERIQDALNAALAAPLQTPAAPPSSGGGPAPAAQPVPQEEAA